MMDAMIMCPCAYLMGPHVQVCMEHWYVVVTYTCACVMVKGVYVAKNDNVHVCICDGNVPYKFVFGMDTDDNVHMSIRDAWSRTHYTSDLTLHSTFQHDPQGFSNCVTFEHLSFPFLHNFPYFHNFP